MKRLTGGRPLMAMGVVFLAACSGDSGGDGTSGDAGVVNVYSHRHYDTDQCLEGDGALWRGSRLGSV